MKRDELITKTDAVYTETQTAVQTIINELNKGQRKKIANNENVKPILERYKIVTD